MQRFDCAVCNMWTLLFSEEATLNLVTLQVGSSLCIFYTLHDQNLAYSMDKVMIVYIRHFYCEPEAFGQMHKREN